jgi:hypothetical protein
MTKLNKYTVEINRTNSRQFVGHVEAANKYNAIMKAEVVFAERISELTQGEGTVKLQALNFHNPLDTTWDEELTFEILDRDSTQEIKKFYNADLAKQILNFLGRKYDKQIDKRYVMVKAHAMARKMDARFSYKTRISAALKAVYLSNQQLGTIRRADVEKLWSCMPIANIRADVNASTRKFILRVNCFTTGMVEITEYKTVDMGFMNSIVK